MTGVIIGVDPGKSGAIAALDRTTGMLLGVHDMPVVGPIISAVLLDEAVHNYVDPLLRLGHNPGVAVIEDVHA